MAQDRIRAKILQQLEKERPEFQDFLKKIGEFKEALITIAFGRLTPDEKALWDLYQEGKISNETIETNTNVDISGLFPYIMIDRGRYYHFTDTRRLLREALREAGLPYYLPIMANSNLIGLTDFEGNRIIRENMTINLETEVPDILSFSFSSPKVWKEAKKELSPELYTYLHESTKNLIEATQKVISIIVVLNNLLLRKDVTLEYLSKNYKELYQVYERANV